MLFGDDFKTLLTVSLATMLLCCVDTQHSMPADTPSTTKPEVGQPSPSSTQPINSNTQQKPAFTQVKLAEFDQPWAIAVLPPQSNRRQLLVTQKTGELLLFDVTTGKKQQVAGVPAVDYGGQGGLGDIVLAPDFATSQRLYISYVEADQGNKKSNKRGAKVVRVKLDMSAKPKLQDVEPIWTQHPKTTGYGHYSHRLLISPDGKYIFISSGDRQKLTPAQDLNSSLGKIIRLHLDGNIPKDNPFAHQPAPTNATWSYGHRNTLGMQFDKQGKLWQIEMGPRGGDELNIIKKGANYGWPLVSEGMHYSGRPIPNHRTRPEFTAPEVAWVPSISPASLALYYGDTFADWQGKALLSGLSSQALVVVDLAGMNSTKSPQEVYRYELGTRLRNVTIVGDDVYLLEDGNNASLWQLTPPSGK